jgi:ribosome-associated protein YbcJ (S4-like RNA binding protein)
LVIACRREGLGEIGLYVTPPRQEIDLDKTFKEEGLVPTGKVFVYFKGGGVGGEGKKEKKKKKKLSQDEMIKKMMGLK